LLFRKSAASDNQLQTRSAWGTSEGPVWGEHAPILLDEGIRQ